jgi:putative membrane protein
MDIRDLPALNALLNTMAAALLVAGYRRVRRGDREGHKRIMLMALGVSALFLASYLVYHYSVGSVRFQKQGPIRWVYFAILISHTVLAAAVAPMAIVTVWRAFRGSFARHRALARITLPLWLYVSVTGVAVYWMLYRM